MLKKILTNIIKNPIFIAIVVALGMMILFNWKINSLNDDIEHWRNEAAKKDTLTIVDSTLNTKLAQTALRLKSENNELNKLLKKEKAKIKTQLEINAQLQDSIINLSTQTSSIVIVDGDTLRTRTFRYNKNAFKLAGYFEIDIPYRISFDTLLATLDMEINVTEDKKGVWKAFIDTKNPHMTISKINTYVIPYTPTIWEKINIGLGAYVGKNNAGFIGNVGYSKYNILIGYTTTGIILGGMYWIK